MDKYSILKQYYGHSAFRAGQEELIDSILSGRDALCVMPTGGGKSLCYQIPALLLPGITLVVSPLISLMKDQVAALKSAGVPAAYINSSLTGEQIRTVYARTRKGAYKLIYVAPERLETNSFLSLMQEMDVSFLAVDEAHCISQWGQDFRPSYLGIVDFINALPRRPIVAAYTATATKQVQSDILRLLQLQSPYRIVTGFDRPNLYFDVRRPKNKFSALAALIDERRGRSGIVYCATRVAVERVCDSLCDRGIAATRYHAGLTDEERQQNQDDFQFDRKTVMVATNAFGMGIDKSNVSFVIHYNMPKSLEAYYQEAGRAGRDGENADCVLLFAPADVETARFLIENGGADQLSEEDAALVRKRDYERLQAMTGYCKSVDCLRGRLLDYFGQIHPANCGKCSNCKATYQTEDITLSAQMILSCVMRIRERLGYYVGKTLVIQVLRGSRDQRLLSLGLASLSTYGLMDKTSPSVIERYIEYLESAGYLEVDQRYSTLRPTKKASAVLFDGECVLMQKRVEPKTEKKRPRGAFSDEFEENSLYEALRAQRAELAKRESAFPPTSSFRTRRSPTWRRKRLARSQSFSRSRESASGRPPATERPSCAPLRSIYSSRGEALLLQHRAVCQGDGIAVEVDGAVVGEARKRAVAGQVPRAAALDRDNRVVADGDAALGIVDDVDGAGEGAAVFHRHRERRDGIDDDVARKRLAVRGEFDLRTVAAGRAPAALALLPTTRSSAPSASLLTMFTPESVSRQWVFVMLNMSPLLPTRLPLGTRSLLPANLKEN